MGSGEDAKRFLLHMRMTFNFVLSPLYAWGAFLTGKPIGGEFAVGFVAFHVFLYGGTNMFNSYYDRDEGPIGGLEQPPPVDSGLLWGSLALKAIGLLMALPLGWEFSLCYGTFLLYSVVYSHPTIRVKRRPLLSAVTVFLGQGLVGFAAGWTANGNTIQQLARSTPLIAMLGGALLTTGIYPLTQLYQIAEDEHRGDLTLTRWLGSKGTFVTVSLLLLTAAACIGYTFWSLGHRISCVLLTAYFLFALGAMALLFRLLPSLTARQIYRRVMTFNYLNAALLLVVLAVHLLTE